MTKSQLVEKVTASLKSVPKKEVEIIVDTIFEQMTAAMARDERVEIRGFGSFTTRIRESRQGRNPKTGEPVSVPRKRVPFFTVGKELKERVNTEEDGGDS